MTNFKTLAQFFEYFKDEATCVKYLEDQRWGGNPTCPFCTAGNPYITNRGYKCRNKECYKKFTAKVGTIYENSKIPLRTFFAAVYLCTANKKGISSLSISRQLGVTQKSAWFILHRVREMLKEKAPVMLVDEVQFDETYFGGHAKNKHASKRKDGTAGRNLDTKTPIIGVIQTGGKVAAHVSQFVSKKAVIKIIDKHVKDGATMVTDGFAMYAFLATDKRFKHVIVDHKNGQYVNGGFHTNGIENFWSHLKRGLYGIYHHVSEMHLQSYCNEFAARYNSRHLKDHERFEQTIGNSEGRLKYNELIGKTSK